MKTKGQRKAGDRRIQRTREKASLREDSPDRDTTLGRTRRRFWGCGKVK